MDEYVKIVLYAFPLLKTVEKDYGDHIKNRAVLSYRSDAPALAVAQYIAGEIVEKERLVWLKDTVQRVLDELSEEERALIGLRYFGKARKKEENINKVKSESTYYRLQNRLGKKVGEQMKKIGLTKSLYADWFMAMPLFQKVEKYLKRKEKCIPGMH